MKGILRYHGHSFALQQGNKLTAFASEDFTNDYLIGKLSNKNCEELMGDPTLNNINGLDVEIVTEPYPKINEFKDDGKTYAIEVENKPKLDSEGNLILKEII